MKNLFLLVVICIVSNACGAFSAIAPTHTPELTTTDEKIAMETTTPLPTPTVTFTPTYILTLSPSATPTRTPAPTRTPYLVLPFGINTWEEMQRRIEEWVSGKIKLKDEDLWLDVDQSIIRLGLYNRVIENVDFMFYNLGFLILEDKQGNPYLLNVAGFEDQTGQRFTFTFHNGELFASYKTIILKEFTNGRVVNSGIQIKFENLTPFEFVEGHYGGVVDLVNMGSTYIGPAERPEFKADFFLRSSEVTTRDLVDFLACVDCSLEDIPESLRAYINTIPLEFDVKIPYLWLYVVKYW